LCVIVETFYQLTQQKKLSANPEKTISKRTRNKPAKELDYLSKVRERRPTLTEKRQK